MGFAEHFGQSFDTYNQSICSVVRLQKKECVLTNTSSSQIHLFLGPTRPLLRGLTLLDPFKRSRKTMIDGYTL